MRRWALVLVVSILLPSGAWAATRLTATDVRIGDHPGFVRVVVDFRGGAPLRLGEVELRDPDSLFRSGRAELVVRRRGVRDRAGSERRHGVRADVEQGRGRLLVSLVAAARRFKYVQEEVLRHPTRLVLDLWEAAPPRGAAAVRNDGCLALDAFSVAPGVARARGRALQPLFESALVVSVRSASGRLRGRRPATAVNDRWRRRVPYSVSRAGRGTLEAAVFSAKDGSLECLVQVPVRLRP